MKTTEKKSKYIIAGQRFDSIFVQNAETGDLVLTLWGNGRVDVYLDKLNKDIPLNLIKGEMGKPQKSPDILNVLTTVKTQEGNDDIPEVTVSLETYVKPVALPDELRDKVIEWVKEQKNEKS